MPHVPDDPEPEVGALQWKPTETGLLPSVSVEENASIKVMEFYDSQTKIGTRLHAPWEVLYSHPNAWGCHNYWLKATDVHGHVFVSPLEGLCLDS